MNDKTPGPPLPDPIFPQPVAREVEDELAFHLEMRAREYQLQGLDADTARRRAAADFPDRPQVAAECRAIALERETTIRRSRMAQEFAQDLRFAIRMLARRPAFALLAILTIGLGIGAATSIYTVVNGVLLRPLPFAEQDRLVAVWQVEERLRTDPVMSRLWDRFRMSALELTALREGVPAFAEVGAWTNGFTFLEQAGGAERVPMVRATANMLPLLKERPVIGRGFLPGEDVLNGPPVALVSHEFWQSRLGGDSGVVGRLLQLDDRSFEVIGVLPPGLRLDRAAPIAPIWLPAFQDSSDMPERRNAYYMAVARLADGADLEAATAQATAVIRSVEQNPEPGTRARVDPWNVDQTRDVRGTLWILAAAVGLLLAIACVNVAILLIGEAARRQREIGSRIALGAGPFRILRQLIAEGLAIAGAGAILGVLLSWWGTRALVAFAPARTPGLDQVSLDLNVLGFSLLCTIATGAFFGLAPAFTLLRRQQSSSIRIGSGQTARGTGLQRTFIAAQVALSLILLMSCSLLVRSLVTLTRVDIGFRPEGMSVVQLGWQRPFLESGDRMRAFYTAAEELSSIPGVTAVTASSTAPFTGGGNSSPVEAEGKVYSEESPPPHTQQRYVLPQFLGTMGIPLLAGRAFSEQDRQGGELVAIVSEELARRDWPSASPLGRRLYHQGQWRTVIGVVGDVRFSRLNRDLEPTVYIPFDQYPTAGMSLLIRHQDDANVETLIRPRVSQLDPAVSVLRIDGMSDLVKESYREERYRTVLVSVFGGIAALLAMVGMFGVTARTVSARMREAGIRIALGAPTKAVARLLLSEAMIGVGLGLLIGIPVALALAGYLAPYLYATNPRDPLALMLATMGLGLASLLAALIPLQRTRRMDPAMVLRAE